METIKLNYNKFDLISNDSTNLISLKKSSIIEIIKEDSINLKNVIYYLDFDNNNKQIKLIFKTSLIEVLIKEKKNLIYKNGTIFISSNDSEMEDFAIFLNKLLFEYFCKKIINDKNKTNNNHRLYELLDENNKKEEKEIRNYLINLEWKFEILKSYKINNDLIEINYYNEWTFLSIFIYTIIFLTFLISIFFRNKIIEFIFFFKNYFNKKSKNMKNIVYF